MGRLKHSLFRLRQRFATWSSCHTKSTVVDCGGSQDVRQQVLKIIEKNKKSKLRLCDSCCHVSHRWLWPTARGRQDSRAPELPSNGGKMSLAVNLAVRSQAPTKRGRNITCCVFRRSWQLAVVFCLGACLHDLCHGLALMLPGGAKLPPPAPLAMRQRTTKLRDPETGMQDTGG